MPEGHSLPKVSVILATYNRAELLPRAIESVLAQTFQDWELLIINDGSTDRTSEVIESYLQKDSRVRVIHQKNQGLPNSRANGVTNVSAEYVAFLDDDDLYYPEKLKMQLDYMENHSEFDLIYSHVRVRGEGHTLPEIYPEQPSVDFQGLMRSCKIQTNAVLVRREAFRRFGNFRNDIGSCDDHDMWLRIAINGKIGFLPIVTGEYWWHPANMSRNQYLRARSERQIYRAFLKKNIPAEDKAAIREVGSFRNYLRASDALDQKDYTAAAEFYATAISFDPFVGGKVPWNPKAGKIYRFLRPYLGFIFSASKCFMVDSNSGLNFR